MNQIKTITLSTGTWVFAIVPKENWCFHIKEYKDGDPYLHSYPEDGGGGIKPIGHNVDLPSGHTYTLIGKASELDNEKWRDILNNHPSESAIKAANTLLKSQGMDIDTCVIIKQD